MQVQQQLQQAKGASHQSPQCRQTWGQWDIRWDHCLLEINSVPEGDLCLKLEHMWSRPSDFFCNSIPPSSLPPQYVPIWPMNNINIKTGWLAR
jgi:hypothetical protein